MKLKGIIMEDFCNYKSPSLFLITSICDWKCCKEAGLDISICQNNTLAQNTTKEYSIESIYNVYVKNDITKSIVIGGLEPILQFQDIHDLISYFRCHGCNDVFVIYTGYYKDEILDAVNSLCEFSNIIIKFGRYVPNHKPHYDQILGVNLASDNQYAEVIS